ncbi:WD40-repeat-containing domain protein [Aspergillus recurvatus]
MNVIRTSHFANLVGHYTSVTSIAFSPDGRFGVAASSDKRVRLWSADTKKPHLVLSGHPLSVTGVMISPDGKLVGSLCGSSIVLRDSQTGDQGTLKDPSFFITGATLTTEGTNTLSTYNRAVQLRDLVPGTLPITLKAGQNMPSVTAVIYSSDGKLIASTSGTAVTLGHWLRKDPKDIGFYPF